MSQGEDARKPGHEVQKHLSEMWFVTPTAARWGNVGEENIWVAHHAPCIEQVRARKDGIDTALVGDGTTQGWGGGWDGEPAAAAHSIKPCLEDLGLCCPKSQIVLVKVLPVFDPGKEAGKAVADINALLTPLNLESNPQVHVLDLWSDFTNANGTLKNELYSDGHLHLGPAGNDVFASKLKRVTEIALARQ